MTTLADFSAIDISGQSVALSQFIGQVVLIVNTASRCGFTPQYAGLEDLYQQFKPHGLVILGFPCNQFAGQEPDDETQIAQFCTTRFGVTFPLFKKIDVNGANAHPLFVFLKQEATGLLGSGAIKWNFTKFLIDKKGNVVRRYAPLTKPSDLAFDIERLCGSNEENKL